MLSLRRSEPKRVIRTAAVLSYAGAAMAIVAGALLQVTGRASDFGSPNTGWGMVVVGAIFGLLAWFISRGSRITIALALIFLLADGVMSTLLALEIGETPGVAGLIMRLVLIVFLGRAFLAATRLKRRQRGVSGGAA